MNIILMGTSSWVIPMFERVAAEHDIVAVFTRAPKPQGRKQILTKSPVHQWAESKNIQVFTSIKEFNHKPDFIVVASYGVILRDNVLSAAKCINVHPSDLPKYRGPSPITTAIYNGDMGSAVCLMQVAAAVDAGDVYMRQPFEISENDTTATIEKLVGEIGAEMLSKYLSAPENYPPHPQTGEPTFTRKWTGADEIIDWSKSAAQIHNQIRSIGGRTKINGLDVKIISTHLENDKLIIDTIQPAGKKPMAWRDFENGQHGTIQINS